VSIVPPLALANLSHTSLNSYFFTNRDFISFLVSAGADRIAVFGGESYRPSAYYNDVWTLDVTHLRQPLSEADASVSARRAEAASAAALTDSLPSDGPIVPVWFLSVLAVVACLMCVCRRSGKKRKSLLD
jgi:hypothetical protein